MLFHGFFLAVPKMEVPFSSVLHYDVSFLDSTGWRRILCATEKDMVVD